MTAFVSEVQDRSIAPSTNRYNDLLHSSTILIDPQPTIGGSVFSAGFENRNRRRAYTSAARFRSGHAHDSNSPRHAPYGGGAHRPPGWFAKGTSSRIDITVPFGST